jgi:hypothetical protein
MKKLITIKPRAAKAAGYHALTSAFNLPREQTMLDNVCADLRRGNIRHVFVASGGGVCVWRSTGGKAENRKCEPHGHQRSALPSRRHGERRDKSRRNKAATSRRTPRKGACQ